MDIMKILSKSNIKVMVCVFCLAWLCWKKGIPELYTQPKDICWTSEYIGGLATVAGLPPLNDSAEDFLIFRENEPIRVHKFDNLPDSGTLSIILYVI